MAFIGRPVIHNYGVPFSSWPRMSFGQSHPWFNGLYVSKAKKRRTKKNNDTQPTLEPANLCSQVDDTHPLAYGDFSPDLNLIATAGWYCTLADDRVECRLSVLQERGVWSVPICVGTASINLQSCVFREKPLVFHPSIPFLRYTCFGAFWCLCDIEQQQEILPQEGHSKFVYDISFQCDRSVMLTSGLDCYGRVWDLRTGRCVMLLEGHWKPILTVKFMPSGYHMVTGTADNSCKVWGLCIRVWSWSPARNTIKVWMNPGWQPLKTLVDHESCMLCVAPAPSNN